MKIKRSTLLRIIAACAALGSAPILYTGCVGVAYTEPGTGVYYGYDYYPDENVYYYPERHIYYWNDGGVWHNGSALPPTYHVYHERHEYLRLHTEQPWTVHREHEENEEHEHSGGAYHYEHHDHD